MIALTGPHIHSLLSNEAYGLLGRRRGVPARIHTHIHTADSAGILLDVLHAVLDWLSAEHMTPDEGCPLPLHNVAFIYFEYR